MATSSVALGVFLFHPEPFDVRVFPFEYMAAFLLGAVLCANISAVRRALCVPRLLEENVKRAARAAFVELGVSRTRQRGGVLVYVSLFERRVEVVADVGVDDQALGAEYRDAVRALELSIAQDGPYDAFVKALARIEGPLASTLPRTVDDVNELGDDVHEGTA
jgi:putative membrane protein